MSNKKRCTKCKRFKLLTEFYKTTYYYDDNSTDPNNYKTSCKKCAAIVSKKQYARKKLLAGKSNGKINVRGKNKKKRKVSILSTRLQLLRAVKIRDCKKMEEHLRSMKVKLMRNTIDNERGVDRDSRGLRAIELNEL